MARSLRYFFVLLFLGVSVASYAQTVPGEISGIVLDDKGQPVITAAVTVSQGGIPKGGTVTDIDGKFDIKPIDPGRYDVSASYLGYKKTTIRNVVVSSDKTTGLKFNLETSSSTTLTQVNIIDYKIPLVDSFATGNNHTINSETIQKLPTHSTADMVSLSAGVYQQRNGGGISMVGDRDGSGTMVIIDGQQVNGTSYNLPANSIDQIEVMPSGLSAKYGNVSGGVINIVTKGSAPKLMGNASLEHSIDGYNNNQVNFSLTGPLISKRDSTMPNHKKTIVGFFLGGNYEYDIDNDPSYYGYYVAKDNVLADLRQNPLKITSDANGQPVYKYATEFVTQNDLKHVKANPNALTKVARFNGKLDFRMADNLSLTAGGTFNYSDYQNSSRGYSLFAPEATPEVKGYTGRAWVRFAQKFGKPDTGKHSPISNAYYTIQADYQRTNSRYEDPRFKHNIFNYLYLGKFNQVTTPYYAPGVDSASNKNGVIYQTQIADHVTFQPSDLNPNLTDYTSEYFNTTGTVPQTYNDVRNNRALLNGDLPQYTYGLWANVGTALNGYNVNRSDQFSLSVDASFDLQLGKIRHSIEFGLYYQQRVERNYTLLASRGGTASLWQLMSQLTNSHISLDKKQPIFIVNGKHYTLADIQNGLANPGPSDTITYNYYANTTYNNSISTDTTVSGKPGLQETFDMNLRKKLGLDPNGTDMIDVFGLDPNMLSVDMFSADELLNSGNPFVFYQGYSYTGQLQTGQVNFNDFWTAKDANGNYTRPIGAFRPNYSAGYIQDKFQIQHILFNVGLRVERYDAANKVLKDPYSLYQEQTVADFGGDHPSNIGSNYVVYVDDNNSSKPNVLGYRNGDNWYDATGKYIEDPSLFKSISGRDPQPALVKDGNNQVAKITDSAFNPNSSFTDYTPQVNLMPRLGFSFPVSDVAVFYGHYDIYSLNPSSGYVVTTPFDYFYLTQNSNSIINNPALKPQRTYDYELGFKQRLSDQSAITISGFYRERKDMIQVRPYLYAWPTTYYTYGNRDFSTTKGMTLNYDLRRFNHLQMNVSYTLQFAEGTGSSTTSTNGGSSGQVASSGILQTLISAGLPNLRYVFPLGIDSRHNIAVNMDYRYDQGEGPIVGGNHILQNAGINLIIRARSGEPYTQRTTPDPSNHEIVGSVNGARLPWHFGADLRIDKNFTLAFGKKSSSDNMMSHRSKMLSFNAYVYIKNVLNIKDILSVYPYTGSATDDGYLTSSYGQQVIPNQTYAPSYIDLYTLSIQNPGLVNLPRQIFLGLQFNF